MCKLVFLDVMIYHAVTIVSCDKKVHLWLWFRVGQSILHLVLLQILRLFLVGFLEWAFDLRLWRYYLSLLWYYHWGAHVVLSCLFCILSMWLLLNVQVEASTAHSPHCTLLMLDIFLEILIVQHIFVRFLLMLISVLNIFQMRARVLPPEYLWWLEKCTLRNYLLSLVLDWGFNHIWNFITHLRLFLIVLGIIERMWFRGQK